MNLHLIHKPLSLGHSTKFGLFLEKLASAVFPPSFCAWYSVVYVIYKQVDGLMAFHLEKFTNAYKIRH